MCSVHTKLRGALVKVMTVCRTPFKCQREIKQIRALFKITSFCIREEEGIKGVRTDPVNLAKSLTCLKLLFGEAIAPPSATTQSLSDTILHFVL